MVFVMNRHTDFYFFSPFEVYNQELNNPGQGYLAKLLSSADKKLIG